MTRRNLPKLDPFPWKGWTCGQCGGTDTEVWPIPAPRGTFCCRTCSPAWLFEFMRACHASYVREAAVLAERDTPGIDYAELRP